MMLNARYRGESAWGDTAMKRNAIDDQPYGVCCVDRSNY